MKTIILLDRIAVEQPLADRTAARRHRLGAFSSFASADAWLQAQMPGEWPCDLAIARRHFGFFEATEFALDEVDFHGRRRILWPDGRMRGEIPDWEARAIPWQGEASECRFSAGDIVGFVSWNEFRWGIVVNGRWDARDGGEWLVDVADGSHCHPHGCELFRIASAVPRETRAVLRSCLRKAKQEGIVGI